MKNAMRMTIEQARIELMSEFLSIEKLVSHSVKIENFKVE
jgi:hypothetical protein